MTLQTTDAFDIAATSSILTGRNAALDRGRRDAKSRCTIRNERVKLASGFMNAVGLTLIAFALLGPVTKDISALTPLSFLWVALGVGLHFGAHCALGWLADPDTENADPGDDRLAATDGSPDTDPAPVPAMFGRRARSDQA